MEVYLQFLLHIRRIKPRSEILGFEHILTDFEPNSWTAQGWEEKELFTLSICLSRWWRGGGGKGGRGSQEEAWVSGLPPLPRQSGSHIQGPQLCPGGCCLDGLQKFRQGYYCSSFQTTQVPGSCAGRSLGAQWEFCLPVSCTCLLVPPIPLSWTRAFQFWRGAHWDSAWVISQWSQWSLRAGFQGASFSLLGVWKTHCPTVGTGWVRLASREQGLAPKGSGCCCLSSTHSSTLPRALQSLWPTTPMPSFPPHPLQLVEGGSWSCSPSST